MQFLITVFMAIQGGTKEGINPPPPTPPPPPPPGLPIDSYWLILLVAGVVIGFMAKKILSSKALVK